MALTNGGLRSNRLKGTLHLCIPLILLVLLTGPSANAQFEYVYVVNNNFYALRYGDIGQVADPNGSLSTVTAWQFNPANNTLSKVGVFAPPGGDVANKDASQIVSGYRVGLDICNNYQPQSLSLSVQYNPAIYPPGYYNCFIPFLRTITGTNSPMPIGGALAVWNTVASWLGPANLAVNDYRNGPTLWQINTSNGQLTFQQSMPGGNIGSALAYSNDGSALFVGDYSGSFRVIQNLNGTPTATGPIDVLHNGANWSVVSIKQNPAGTRLAIGIDHLDDTLTIPAEVDIADITQGPPYNIVPIVPINTGGISAVGGMAFSKDGKLVVSNVVNGTISLINLDTMSVVWGPQSLPSNVSEPVEVLFHPSGNYVYMSCRGDNAAGYNYATGNVVAYQYSGSQLSLLGVYPTGTVQTQNLAINNPGSRLYALNSGDIGCPRCSDPWPAPFPPSITVFTINSNGSLTKINNTAAGNTYNNWPVDDSNFYPTGIAMYAPAPRFSAILWNDKGPFPYGTLTTAAVFDATPSVPDTGTITYAGDATGPGTLLSTGVHTLTAVFTPNDTTAYVPSSRSISYTIIKATPTISWNTPASIYPGTALNSTQLNATVNQNQGLTVAGSLTYNPPSGTVLPVGLQQPLTVTFAPSDTANYNTLNPATNLPISKTVYIDVIPRPTTLTSPGTVSVTYGAAWSLSTILSDNTSALLSGKTVTFSIGPNITLAAVTNSSGVASVSGPANLAKGTYAVSVNFVNDPNYGNASASGSVVIDPRPTSLTSPGSISVTYGTAFSLTTKLTDNNGTVLSGRTVTFTVGANITLTAVTNGSGVASVSGPANLNANSSSYPSYPVNVSFAGDTNYGSSSVTGSVQVNPRPTTLTYTGSTSVTVGSAPTLSALLTDSSNGSVIAGMPVTFTINGTGPLSGVSGGGENPSIPGPANLAPGSYTLTVSFSNPPNYVASSQTVTITVNDKPSAVLTYTGSTSVTYPGAPTLSARLTDNSGTVLSGKTVTFAIGTSTPTAVTDANGIASVSGPPGLTAGSYLVTVSFTDPTLTYNNASISSVVQVNPRPTALTYTGSTSVTYGVAPTLSASLVDTISSAGLAGKTVKFLIGGQTLTAVTDSSGVASVPGPADLAAGPNPVTVSFTNDGNYSTSSTSGSVQVNQRTTTLSYAGSTSVTYGVAPTLSAKLVDTASGAGLSGRALTFTINSQTLTAVTDASGVASVPGPTNLAAASTPYSVSVSFSSYDPNYTSSSASASLKVNPRATALTYKGSTSVTYPDAAILSATLVDNVSGAGLSDKTVTFTINNQTLTAVTDSSGAASVTGPSNIPASSVAYKVSVGFTSADPNYSSSTASGTVQVNRRPTSLIYTGTTTVTYGLALPLSARLTDNTGKVLSGKSVTFSIGGTTLSAATDGTGTASVSGPTNLSASSTPYPVSVNFTNDQNYGNATASATVLVNPRPTILFYLGDTSVTYGVVPTLSVQLTDSIYTTLIAGKIITFTLNGIKLTATTDADGIATAAPNQGQLNQLGGLPVGSYTVIASFAGDQNNISSSSSAAIQVSPRLTVLDYTGDLSVPYLQAPTLAAKLTDQVSGKPLARRLVSFTIGSTTYNDYTDNNGIASVRGPANLPPPSFTVYVSYAGERNYAGSTTVATIQISTTKLRPTVLTYTGDTITQFSFAPTLAARLTDKQSGSPLVGRTVTFALSNVILSPSEAVTNANGVASVPGPSNLPLGSYAVTASYAGDQYYMPSQTGGALLVLQVVSSEGKVTGGGIQDNTNGRGGFNVQAKGNRVYGELQYKNNLVNFHAHKMTALGISADCKSAWFSGIGGDGKTTFLAYVEDNGEPGKKDVFKIWIGGVLLNGDGTMKSGNIQIHKDGRCEDKDDEGDRYDDHGGFCGGDSSGDVWDDHNGHCTFSLWSDGHRERGDLQYRKDSVNFHSRTMNTLSISKDGLSAWLAGTGDDGKPFVAYVENNKQSGGKFKLWISGVRQNDGAVKSGTIQIHAKK